MKKNLLFSIALCLGLMLPAISFASESHAQSTVAWVQSLVQQTAQGFSSYISNLFGENTKLVLLAALMLPTWIFLQSRNSKNQEQKVIHNLLDKIASKYNLNFNASYGATDPNHINTVAKFLSHEEWHNWEQYKQKTDIKQNYKEKQLTDIEDLKTENPHAIFEWFVWPILDSISLPNQLKENPTAQEIQEYSQKNKDIWIKFMVLVRTNNAHILLPHKNNYYFKIIQGYLSTIPDRASQLWAKSIGYAIDEGPTKPSTASAQEPQSSYSAK